MFDDLYKPYKSEREAFKENWRGPDVYKHGKHAFIAAYNKPKDSDGQSVDVFCCPMPARFYILKARVSKDSMGRAQPAYEVSTGSGEAELISKIAEAISEGMLSFKPAKGQP